MPSLTARPNRTASALLTGGLLLATLAGCSADPEPMDPDVFGAEATDEPEPAAEPTGTGEPGAAEAADGPDGVTGLQCSANSCTVTLSGNAEVEVFGTPVSLAGVENGRATIGIGPLTASCSPGERIEAGVFSVECTSVSGDSLTLTAGLG